MSRHRFVETTLTVERNEEEIELTVSGDFYPGDSGDYWEPPSPPEVDGIEAKVKATGADFELTDEELDKAIEAIMEEASELHINDMDQRAGARAADRRDRDNE